MQSMINEFNNHKIDIGAFMRYRTYYEYTQANPNASEWVKNWTKDLYESESKNIDRLEGEYFDKLMEEGISYFEYETHEQNHQIAYVNDKYLLSPDQMAQYLNFTNYLDWRENGHK